MSHIGIYADEPLPVTSTGYRSVFLTQGEIEEGGGVPLLIESMLNEVADSVEWRELLEKRKQLSLF